MLATVAITGLLAPSSAFAAARWETLEAIHRIENPHDSTAPGRYGELGAYQFRRHTWRMHTDLPFERALDRSTSESVAVRHYEWLRRGLIRNGLSDSPYNIALAWNGGLTATVRGRAPRSAHEYAERVANMAHEIRVSQLARAPEGTAVATPPKPLFRQLDAPADPAPASAAGDTRVAVSPVVRAPLTPSALFGEAGASFRFGPFLAEQPAN